MPEAKRYQGSLGTRLALFLLTQPSMGPFHARAPMK
jgi:hypothetical protein